MTAALPASSSCRKLPIDFDGKSSLCIKYCFKHPNSYPILGFSGTKRGNKKAQSSVLCNASTHRPPPSDCSVAQEVSDTERPFIQSSALTKCHLLLYTLNFLKLKVSQKCISYATLLHDFNTD